MTTLSVLRWDLPLSPDGVVLTCADGGHIRVRPIRGSDAAGLTETYKRLSTLSRYRRFFTQMNELPADLAEKLTEIDHSLHHAWVVFDADDEANQSHDPEHGIAVARLVANEDDPHTAELALAIVDDHQGRGIGNALMELLLSTAAMNDISVIRADTMHENKAMIRLLRSRGAVSVSGRTDIGIASYDLPVPEVDETTGALYDLLRLRE